MPFCHSTNDIAADLVRNSQLKEGAVVITDNQTSGKGQRGNLWESNPNSNLTFSLVLKPHFLDVSEQYFLNIAISLALHDFLSQYMGEGIRIKWPNDLYFYDNKLGGILIENGIKKNQLEYAIVGIGLNINQKKFHAPNATSLSLACGQDFDLEEVLPLLLHALESRYIQLKKVQFTRLLEEYYQKLYWMHEKHLFKGLDYFEGTIQGIDKTGRIIISTHEKNYHFNIKEVKFIR